MRRDPFAQAPHQAPINALEYFTNREGFIEAFSRHRETPADRDLSVLVFYGVGGIGKTTLIRKLCADLAHAAPPLPHVRYNLENVTDQAQSYRDVLLRLRSDLESEFHLKFPNFDLALAVLLAREGGERPPLVKISSGLSSAFDMALELTPELVKTGLKVAGRHLHDAVSRSETLENWVRHMGGTEAVLDLSERFAQDDETIMNELIRRFAQDLSNTLPERPRKACRGVIFLDTYESLWTGRESSRAAQARLLDSWVRTLAEYLLGAGVLLVIAGRDRLAWEDHDPEWASCLDQHILGGVSAQDAQSFLAKRGIGVAAPLAPEPLQEAILRCANTTTDPKGPVSCHLLSLALSADIVMNTRHAGGTPDPALFQGVPPAKMASELATRFLKSLHNRNLELWAEALSLTPRFDEAAALALDSARQLHTGRAGWEQLSYYSFVTAQADGFFRMHRTMREVLRGRSPEPAAQALHAWFEQYWRERSEDALAFYHRWCLHPEDALIAWRADHETAVAALNPSEARSLLTRWSEVALDEDDRHMVSAALRARTHLVRGHALRITPLTPRHVGLIGAMPHFRSALSVFTETKHPDAWAEAQSELGRCCLDLRIGDRVEGLHQAAAYFHAASRVWTEAASPERWAQLQVDLGLSNAFLPTGDRAQNLQAADRHFEAALRFWTRTDDPQKWAQLQNNIGCNALLMPTGDKRQNLIRAVACFQAVLEVQTETSGPQLWAKAHHNLGHAYYQLPAGDKADNLRRSLSHYETAMRVNTEEAFPDAWAEGQNNLGRVWAELTGDGPSPFLRQAIAHYEAAQRVWTPLDNPDRWAQAEMNKGDAYRKLPDGDRAQNLRAAIASFHAALGVHTEKDFPETWANEWKLLGLSLQEYAQETGDTSVLAEVPVCFACAVRGFRSVGLTEAADEAERLARENA